MLKNTSYFDEIQVYITINLTFSKELHKNYFKLI